MTYIAWYYRKMEIEFNTVAEMFTLKGKSFYTIAGLADFFGYNFSEFRLRK